MSPPSAAPVQENRLRAASIIFFLCSNRLGSRKIVGRERCQGHSTAGPFARG